MFDTIFGMLFNSAAFAVFFPIVALSYFSIPHRIRWVWLLTASSIFYMWLVPKYILVLGTTIGVDYLSGLLIEKSEGRARRVFLGISVFSTCAILVLFKYLQFFTSSFSSVAEVFGWKISPEIVQWALPIGLSFHTLQGLSYVIEVYRGTQKAERHLGIYALYVMFFPQLVAGPIERPANLIPQFREEHHFSYEQMVLGLKLMGWGLFKKVVVSDRIATLVNPVYSNPIGYDGLVFLITSCLFSIELYCDFSGYSDIARGSAQVLGFHLTKNFDSPVFAVSPTEYWRRWHISLSTWFRDYVYLPLGSVRHPRWRWHLNLLITMAVLGLWHGAGWNFVLFGMIHGMFLIVSNWLIPLIRKLTSRLGIAHHSTLLGLAGTITTICIFTVPTAFFRAPDISTAWYIITHFFSGGKWPYIAPSYSILGVRCGLTMGGVLTTLACAAFLIIVESLLDKPWFISRFYSSSRFLRWSAYYALILTTLVLGAFGERSFLYFQF